MQKLRIPVSSSLPPGVPGLVRWIKATHPAIYSKLSARLAHMPLQGLGLTDPNATAVTVADSGKPGIAQTILSSVKDLISVGLPLYQQQKLFNLQLKRAELGQPMLDTQALSDASAIRVGVDSQTRNTGLWIVGGLVAALLGYKLLSR